MIEIFLSNINSLAYLTGDCSILGKDFANILGEVFTWIQIAVPCLVVFLCSVDVVQAVISQEEKSMKAAQSKALKRIIIGVCIFFVPLLINILLDMASLVSGTCSIGG